MKLLTKKLKEEIKLHLKDAITSLRFKNPDVRQAEHNLFEIANHLDISDSEIVEFECFRCKNIFESQFASQNDNQLCKYCEEFDDDNGEMKESI